MIGRDKIVVDFKRDGVPESHTMYAAVVTDQLDGKLAPFGGSLVFQNYYRLIFPRTLDLTGAEGITLSFRNRTCVRLETPIVPVYDGRGRVHHYEGVVRSS